MEHIVQIAIGVDDESIKKNVEAYAEKEIIKNIQQEVRNKLFDSGSHYREAKPGDPLSCYSERILTGFLEKNKNEIVERASEILADRLMRTKRVKEAVENIVGKE